MRIFGPEWEKIGSGRQSYTVSSFTAYTPHTMLQGKEDRTGEKYVHSFS